MCHHDQDKNTPLHIAASVQNKIEKIKIIADILKLGTNPKLINKNGENFYSHLKKMPDQWFEELYKDKKLRKIFINLGDDESVSFMFEKFRDLSTTLENPHPIDLVKEIFENKDKFNKAFPKLLDWEGEYHKNDSAEVRQCCYAEVDPNKAYNVNQGIQEIIIKTLTKGYFVKNAFKGTFLYFLFVKLVDFVTDITMNIRFYPNKNDTDSIFQHFNQTCIAASTLNSTLTNSTAVPLECYFYKMNDWMLFVSSLLVFALTYFSDGFFVMTNENTQQYKSVMVPCFCCLEKLSSQWAKSFLRIYWYGILPFFNQVFIYIYGFWVRTFVGYWKRRHQLEKAIQNETEKYDELDGKVLVKEENPESSSCWKWLACCDKKSSKTAKSKPECKNPYCYKNIKYNDIDKLDQMQDHCDKTVTIGKIVTSSTENSFMPLLQLSILFPGFMKLFPATIENGLNFQDIVSNNTKVANLRLIVIITSIITSLMSMGIALTETYFSKSGRRTYKTPGRWLLYFSSILFQVVPKIFAYQVFAFGFVPYVAGDELGPDLIIPVLLGLPLVLSILRAIVFHWTVFHFKEFPKRRESLLFGLATMYVCSENDFHYRNALETKDAQNSKTTKNDDLEEQDDIEMQPMLGNNETTFERNLSEKGKTRQNFELCHIIFDTSSFLITLALTISGALLLDAKIDRVLFIIVITEMQLFGLLLKSTYYLHVHPWEKLNPKHKFFVKLHGVMSVVYFVCLLSTVIYYGVTSIRIFTISLLMMIFPIGLVSLILKKN